jgi:hypothetical protein
VPGKLVLALTLPSTAFGLGLLIFGLPLLLFPTATGAMVCRGSRRPTRPHRAPTRRALTYGICVYLLLIRSSTSFVRLGCFTLARPGCIC